jgi:DNA-binding MarR family transcriptional regulator
LNLTESKQFREKIRILERKLGLLKKGNDCSYCKAVTLTQCHALVEIGRSNTTTLKDLSVILALDVSTTSRTVDSLVKKNYVLRSPCAKDRRSVDIRLSDEGTLIFQNIEESMDKEFNEIFSSIPHEEKYNVLHSLDIILEAFSSNTEANQ